jgi:hypothetical protein
VVSVEAFSADQTSASQRFRAAATRLGWRLAAYPITTRGPAGEELTIDVAWSGQPDDRNALIVSSGLHGVEGYLGSAVQLAFLEQEALQPRTGPRVRLVLIHGLNPYGFAWSRRVNEDNVDPNRNFLLAGETWSGCPPGYEAFDHLLNPKRPPARWDSFILRGVAAVLRHGIPTLKQAIATGQYEYPQGLFFGGKGPTRTLEILREHLPAWLAGCDRVVHLDFHTGLGRWKTWKLLVDTPMTDAQRSWLLRCFGAEAFEESTPHGVAYRARGTFGPWCMEQNPQRNHLYLCAEFGTYSALRIIAGLRAENQAHHWSQPGSAATERARLRLRELFCPADIAWRNHALQQGLLLVERVLGGLQDGG